MGLKHGFNETRYWSERALSKSMSVYPIKTLGIQQDNWLNMHITFLWPCSWTRLWSKPFAYIIDNMVRVKQTYYISVAIDWNLLFPNWKKWPAFHIWWTIIANIALLYRLPHFLVSSAPVWEQLAPVLVSPQSTGRLETSGLFHKEIIFANYHNRRQQWLERNPSPRLCESQPRRKRAGDCKAFGITYFCNCLPTIMIWNHFWICNNCKSKFWQAFPPSWMRFPTCLGRAATTMTSMPMTSTTFSRVRFWYQQWHQQHSLV